MVKRLAGKHWVVKTSGGKATYLHREPSRYDSSSNAAGVLRNGQLLVGEFMHVRRASRETGFIKVRHMEPTCGSTWRVRNADGSPTTLLRKQPLEAHDAGNAVGYASEGELLESESSPAMATGGRCGAAAPGPRRAPPAPRGPEWTVLDREHDGAWLRRAPRSDLGQQNVVCLVRNGDVVVGDLLHVRRQGAQEGAVRLRDLEQLSARAWRVRSSGGFPRAPLWREPAAPLDAANTVGQAKEGEQVEGEFVFVTRKDGKRSGYVRPKYLTAAA